MNDFTDEIYECLSTLAAAVLGKHGAFPFRVWPDGTVQAVEDGAPHSHMSDDFIVVFAASESDALLRSPQ